jgi:cell wall-associated NlpC family hydrolase
MQKTSLRRRASMPRLLFAAFVFVCLFAAAPAASAATTLANWDMREQHEVVAAHVMGNVGRSFQGAAPLTASQANAALAAIATRLTSPGVAPHASHSPVSLVTFDQMLVQELGLGDVAAHVQSAASAAGLSPPSYFGSEVVTRFLGLRYNHPAGTDQLELFPSDPITRAEAAWSLGGVLGFGDWQLSYARDTLSSFSLPVLSAPQQQALRIAVSRIGYPYVWGGTTDDMSDGLAHGGFDCSGFAWRVYKLSGLQWGRQIHGRTAAQQAGEIPRSARVPGARLKPGDLLFFGSAHFSSVATESSIDHEGIYLGNNWVIHSSSQGVYVLPLRGSWLGDSFAWGRTVIH